ncbi:hypothetical protein AOQ84DRAFT_440654 [Glonium stellatum]|uniref:Uncharacterized protein n=1 Tax=Glonium stellatum TaxID=574774 RepID=A0A8E2JRA0_9PEZI|nr:hypothetical protein AOQ84DRAFT_440654 [Glonium stellatum]
MDSVPTIHVLEKADYTKQHIVSLPNALSLPPLAPFSVRVKTSLISLTANNLTYARVGHLFGWWDVHPLPPSIPDTFKDASKYGRISGWGYGEIIESNVPEIQTGKQLFGYIPIGTLPVDLEVKLPGAKNQVLVTSPHRQRLLPIYNRYFLALSKAENPAPATHLGYDSLMQVLFETAYHMNRHVFAWDDTKRIHPTGAAALPWSPSDAALTDATIVIFAASSKTALSFAHQLRHNRPADAQPRTIIGVSSAASQPFTDATGFYDRVLLYADQEAARAAAASSPKVVLVDFGARGDALATWHAALAPSAAQIAVVGVGGEVRPMGAEEVTRARLAREAALSLVQVNASGLRDKALEMGEEAWLEEFLAAWGRFKDAGGVPGVELRWAEGMEEWAKAWEGLAQGRIGPETGLLFWL